MSMQYCHTCGRNVDTDYGAEHFIDVDCRLEFGTALVTQKSMRADCIDLQKELGAR